MKSVIVFLKNVWNAQRNARELSDTIASEEMWFQQATLHATKRDEAERENAALRSQISQRDASGRFAKKNAS